MLIEGQTINHRRLIQEIYDDKVLHRLLGVEPRKTVEVIESHRTVKVHSEPNGSVKVTSTSTRIVEEIFEKDMQMNSDMEEDSAPLRVNGSRAEQSDEEGGRYGIASREQPQSKRQKTGKEQDMHNVYTTDDDEDEDLRLTVNTVSDGQTSIEDGEYASGDSKEVPESNSAQRDKKRAYWLAKGVGPGSMNGDSN